MAKYATEGNISHLSTLIIGWVKGLFSSANPLMDGTVAAGTSYKIAREDHRHPTDTSRAPYTPDETAIAANDEIVFADNSDSYHIKRSTIKFDGSTATKALTQKGTWETFNNYSLPTANGSTKGGVTLSDATNGTEGVSGGKAATPKAVSDALAAAKTYADTNDSDTWKANSKTSEGYVAAGGNNANKVWKTDASGAPAWRDDAVGPSYHDYDGTDHGLVPMYVPGAGDDGTHPDIYVMDATGTWDSIGHAIQELLDLYSGDGAGIAASGYIFTNGDGTLETHSDGDLMTSAEKIKLTNIAPNAEVNQNAFSRVTVGSTNIDADTKTDALTLVAGSNVTITPDANNDKVTIAATDTDTKNTAGSNDTSSKIFVVGAGSQTTGSNGVQTYSHGEVWIDTNHHLYSNSKQVVNLSDTQALTNKTYNGYTLGAACEKSIGSVADGNTGLVTGDAVYDAINNVLATSAALVYHGTIGASADSPTITSLPTTYSRGDVYVVKTAGTYAGKVCEVGDMIICNNDNDIAANANNADWDVIQSNIEPLTNTEIETAWQQGLTANGF